MNLIDKRNIFDVVIDEKNGGLSKIRFKNDVEKMNFCKKGGTIGALIGFQVISIDSSENDSVIVKARNNGVFATILYFFKENCLIANYTIHNDNDFPVYYKEGDLSLNMSLNDCYESSNVCIKRRCHAHIFAGENCTNIRAERMGKSEYNLGIVFTEGGIGSYSQEKAKSNNRGYFILNCMPVCLKADESFEMEYVCFRYKNLEEYYSILSNFDTYFEIKTEKYAYCIGDTIAFSIAIKNPVTVALVEANGLECPFDCSDKEIFVKYNAKNTGAVRFDFEVNGKRSHAVFNVITDKSALIGNRLDFIVNKQQCLDKDSPLYGAFLIYDNEEKKQFFDNEIRDYNACRERVGMGILLAKWLQTNSDEHKLKRLILFADFLLREYVDDETGEVFDVIHKNPRYLRLYNAPWIAVFFSELYLLTDDIKYVRISSRVLKHYYSVGGDRFYPNAISFYEVLTVIKNAGLSDEYDDLYKSFCRHADNILKYGINYPPHEVNFEQTIVNPAVMILLDKYRFSADNEYLIECKKHLEILRKFDGLQPDFRLHNIPIRFWDAYWFGKKRTFGDTFPHYWSVLNGYVYCLYGRITGDSDLYKAGKDCVDNCCCLFTDKGEASCAYVYPKRVNGVDGEYFDKFANDQDFALYYLLKLDD